MYTPERLALRNTSAAVVTGKVLRWHETHHYHSFQLCTIHTVCLMRIVDKNVDDWCERSLRDVVGLSYGSGRCVSVGRRTTVPSLTTTRPIPADLWLPGCVAE